MPPASARASSTGPAGIRPRGHGPVHASPAMRNRWRPGWRSAWSRDLPRGRFGARIETSSSAARGGRPQRAHPRADGRPGLTGAPPRVLVRHGETDWNAEGRLLSRTDRPLNDTGERQAREPAAAMRVSGSTARSPRRCSAPGGRPKILSGARRALRRSRSTTGWSRWTSGRGRAGATTSWPPIRWRRPAGGTAWTSPAWSRSSVKARAVSLWPTSIRQADLSSSVTGGCSGPSWRPWSPSAPVRMATRCGCATAGPR